MLASSFTLPLEMFSAASDFARSRNKAKNQSKTKNQKTHADIQLFTLSDQAGKIQTRGGLSLIADEVLSVENQYSLQADLIFLPALWRNPRYAQKAHPHITPWLKNAIQQGSIVCAVGTGVCFIAETGLLDNKPATTHWYYLDTFQKRYPNIQLKRQHLITQAGNIYCAGSINTLADLSVHLIQLKLGKQVGSHVERHFSHEARQPFENMSFLHEATNRHQDEDIIQAQLWLHEHFQQPIALGDIAADLDMSLRNFSRRFKAATEKTPLHYLQELRMSHAEDLLKKSNLTIIEVAHRVGYSDMGHFTRLFKKHFQVTAYDYRKTVRSKLFSVEL